MEPTGLATPSPGQTKSGRARLSRESRVSRTMRRRAGVRRKRRSRVAGKLMAVRLYRGGGGEGNGLSLPGPPLAASSGADAARDLAVGQRLAGDADGDLLRRRAGTVGGVGVAAADDVGRLSAELLE